MHCLTNALPMLPTLPAGRRCPPACWRCSACCPVPASSTAQQPACRVGGCLADTSAQQMVGGRSHPGASLLCTATSDALLPVRAYKRLLSSPTCPASLPPASCPLPCRGGQPGLHGAAGPVGPGSGLPLLPGALLCLKCMAAWSPACVPACVLPACLPACLMHGPALLCVS